MASKPPKPPELGKLELTVKMDYSETYKENEKLDMDLDQHLVEIKRSQHRFLNDKEEELEHAKEEAEKSLKLKEAVARRQSVDALSYLSHPALARRRSSVTISRSVSEKNADEGDSGGGGVYRTESKPTLTERRIAMERDMYSAKRMFNVIRRHTSNAYVPESSGQGGSKNDSSSDGLRKGMSAMNLNGRPKTQPSRGRYGGSGQRNRGYLRPTTAAASRLGRLTSGGSSLNSTDGYGRPQRRARSRLELEKLCRLNIDPFDDVSDHSRRSWTPGEDPKEDMLRTLRARHGQIQARVATFIRELEEFNKRDQKSRLDHILETAG